MEVLILQLATIFTPLVQQVIRDHKAETGQDPTSEQVVARLNAHADQYLGEGSAWLAAHKT